MRRLVLVVLVVVALVGGMVAAPPAMAEDTLCTGTLPPGTYDNVIVPDSFGCTLNDSVVRGSLKVLTMAVLISDNNEIVGNVEGEMGSVLQLFETRVGGNVRASAGNNIFFSSSGGGNQVGGDVVADKTPLAMLEGQTVGGDVNVSETPATTINETTIGGVLEVTKVDFVSLRDDQVGHGVHLEEGGGQIQICGLRVDQGNLLVERFVGGLHVFILGEPQCPPVVIANGNLQAFENAPTVGLFIQGTEVSQNLQVYKTRGISAKGVQNNTVGDTIQCFDNDPFFGGGPNTAQKAEGQCF